jgi:hypothetical protein
MLSLDEARQRAEAVLLVMEVPGVPLMLSEKWEPIHRSWCYGFYWNSRAYFETGDLDWFVAGNGPIVVPLDGGEPFVLPTYDQPDTLLDEYEKKHGLM